MVPKAPEMIDITGPVELLCLRRLVLRGWLGRVMGAGGAYAALVPYGFAGGGGSKPPNKSSVPPVGAGVGAGAESIFCPVPKIGSATSLIGVKGCTGAVGAGATGAGAGAGAIGLTWIG